MSPHDSPSPGSPENIAEFLADRERLAGRAREHFRLLVHEYGGFHESVPPRHSRTLVLVSLLLGCVGWILDHSSRWNDQIVWVEYAVFAAGLAWGFHRDENKGRSSDLETDWEAYCLFLRPVILSDHPGLLDRNANNHVQEQVAVKSNSRPMPMLRGLLNSRGPDFWWSAVGGLWVGLAVLVVTHLTVAYTDWRWSMTFPAGGLLLGLAVWLLWRRLAYVIVRSDSRMIEP